MAEAFLWGLVASSSLVAGAVLALAIGMSRRLIGLITAFGAGVLVSAVAYDLVQEAASTADRAESVAAGLFAGAVTFFLGDTLVDRMGGDDRKDSGGAQAEGTALAVVLGTVLDGVPESLVIGLNLVAGQGLGAAVIVAVFLSNLPEAAAASSGLAASGWRRGRIFGLWLLVVGISSLAAVAGYALFDSASPDLVGFTLAFAGGAILTMLADTMMPQAFAQGGKLAGLVTTLGFALAFAISALE